MNDQDTKYKGTLNLQELLNYYRHNPDATALSASKVFNVSHTTINNALSKLEALGAVRRTLPEGRKRKRVLQIVEK